MLILRRPSCTHTYPIGAVASCISKRTRMRGEERSREPMHLHANIALLGIVTCGIGYLMTVAGLGKGALERKPRHRVCPSCGRQIQARVCRACTN
jgi:hypothetical protein